MLEGKVKAALCVLNKSGSKADQPLSLSSPLSDSDLSLGTVHEAIFRKHPDPAPISPFYSLLTDTPPLDHDPHFVKFESIDGILIRPTIIHMDGAAGPSGMDVSTWKMRSSFGRESEDLCDSIASIARELCTRYVDPIGIEALMASRSIALIKDPGILPIGIGEVCHKLISKAVMNVIRQDILDVKGCQQLCVEQKSSCEAIVHCVRELHQSGKVEGMGMFAVASLPLIKQLDESSDVTQLWYADDATAGGEFQELKRWWDNINAIGKTFGYYANEKKTILPIREESYERACECFHGTGVNIRTDGITLLGSLIGSDSFVLEQIKSKVDNWIRDLELLSEIAET